jgi:hypothetical protein
MTDIEITQKIYNLNIDLNDNAININQNIYNFDIDLNDIRIDVALPSYNVDVEVYGGGSSDYVLPTATDSILGGIKVGARLTITNGVLSADEQGGGVSSVNEKTGDVILDPDDLDDTSTTNKFTTAEDILKLSGIEAGAEVNVNADWNASSGDAQILNKPVLTNYAFIPQNTVEVLTGCTEVAGKRYASIANAITYINTQTPAIDNLWSICCLDLTNSENFTLPDFVGIHSSKGFQGIVMTQFTGNVTLGEYSIANSVEFTGQLTIGSTNAAAPSIVFGAYIMGTLIIAAGHYFQPVNSLLQVSSDLELNGQMQIIGGTWISNNINVNPTGVLVGYINKYGGAIVDKGGTILLNDYGQFFDGSVSGLSATTVNGAIDELVTLFGSALNGKADKTNVLELNNTTPFTPDNDYEPATKKYVDDNGYNSSDFDTDFSSKTTDDLSEGSSNFYYTEDRFDSSFSGKTTDDLPEGDANLYGIWEVNENDQAELQTKRNINIGQNYLIIC